jgi:hypothetical protein
VRGEGEEEEKKKRKKPGEEACVRGEEKKKTRGRRRSVREVRRKPAMLGLGEIKEERWVW